MGVGGLPDFYPGLNPKRADNYLADFGIEQFDDFVSACQLTTDPGTTHLHGPIDLTLLAQAMSTKAGADYELLMAARILEPLKMHDTVFTLTPELKERLAHEHSPFGYAIQPWNWGIHKPSAGLYSRVRYVNGIIFHPEQSAWDRCGLGEQFEVAWTSPNG